MKQKNKPAVIESVKDEAEPPGSLLELVEPELKSLSTFWLGALKDHALLSLSAEYTSQLPPQGGMFYRYIMQLLRCLTLFSALFSFGIRGTLAFCFLYA